ncbi:MAG: hypothetical protein J5590_00955 [Clostridia bacterium]|nr:hypothetical protein [Clostridia bacterium]
MKRIITVLTTIVFIICLCSCGSGGKNESTSYTNNDIQGWWYDDSGLVWGFKGDDYILQSTIAGTVGAGTFKIDGDKLSLSPKDGYDFGAKSYNIKIASEKLTLKPSDKEGETTNWRKISEDEVKKIFG